MATSASSRSLLALFLAVLCCATTTFVTAIPPPPQNYNTLVNLRVEGRDKTIFEGPIWTRGHNVTTASGGNHHCDGTNNGMNPTAGPTCTSALDSAAHQAHFSWDGTFSTTFDDFFITSIGGDTETDTEFWGLLLNFEFTPVGGCQQEVKTGDDILWAFDAFNKHDFLKLDGPTSAKRNQPVKLTVTDGSTGALIEGAEVNGALSDSHGEVTVVFNKVGVNGVKATKADALRSNQLKIQVRP